MRFGAAMHDGVIYVMGGLTFDGGPFLNTTLMYNVALKTWSYGPEMMEGRSDFCAAAADGKIFAVAGFTTGYATMKTVEVMDPSAATPAWAKAADLPQERGDCTCASSGGKVYAIGGALLIYVSFYSSA